MRFSEVTARDKAAHELAGQGPLSEEQKEINRRGIDQFRRVAKAYSEGGVAAVQALNTDSQLAGQGVVETVRPVQDTLF